MNLLRFYVECQRGADGFCNQSGRRKTLRCNVQSHPPATTFRWLKNGVATRLVCNLCDTDLYIVINT